MTLSPALLDLGPTWVTDLVALLITFVVIQALVLINGALQKRELLPTYITRKVIHIFAAPLFVLCWMIYSGAASSRLFAAVVPLAFIVQFTAAGFGWRKDEAFVNSMSRSGDPKELLRGTMHYAIVMLIACLLFFTTGKPGAVFIPTAMILLGALAGGDVLVDDQVGFSVCGGDQISLHLARHYGAARLLFATDVDGVYDRDPKQHADARRIPKLSLSDLGAVALDAHQRVDASVAMAGKFETISQAGEMLAEGMEVHLFSMMKRGNLQALLEGESGIGTEIVG